MMKKKWFENPSFFYSLESKLTGHKTFFLWTEGAKKKLKEVVEWMKIDDTKILSSEIYLYIENMTL